MGVSVHDSLVVGILGQVRVNTGIGRTVLFGEHFLHCVAGFLIGKQGKLFLNARFIIGRVLLQALDIGAFIILRTGNEPCIDPVHYQVVLIYIVAVLCLRQGVQQPPVLRRQGHIAFTGHDGTDPHVSIGFRQVDILFRAGVHIGGSRPKAVGFRQGPQYQRLFGRAKTAVDAGQVDFPPHYGSSRTRLGNIAVCRQGHVACAIISVGEAFQLPDLHIAGQGLALRRTAPDGHVNIAAPGGNRTKYHLVRGGIGVAVPAGGPGSQGGNMDIFNIFPGLQVCLPGDQGRISLLDDAARRRMDGQGPIGRIVFDRICQVDTGSLPVAVCQGDAAVFLTDEADADIPVRLQGEGVGLAGAGLSGPFHMVFGVGPQSIPVAALLPLAGHGAGIAGDPVLVDRAELRAVQLLAVFCVVDRINKGTAAQTAFAALIDFFRFGTAFQFLQLGLAAAGIQRPPEQGVLDFMVILRSAGLRAQGPVIAQAFLHFIRAGGRGPAVVADTGCGLRSFFRRSAVLGIFAVIFNGFRRRTGVFRPGIPGQVRNGDLAFDIIIEHLAYVQAIGGIIGNGNIRAPVRRQDPAVAGAGDPARQVDLAASGIDVLYQQPVVLGVVIDLHHVFKAADTAIIDRFAAVVHLVHGTTLDGNRPVSRFDPVNII